MLERDLPGNLLAWLVRALLNAGGLLQKVRARGRLDNDIVRFVGFDLNRGGNRHALLVDLGLAVEIVAHLLDIELALTKSGAKRWLGCACGCIVRGARQIIGGGGSKACCVCAV